jgi:hypothetical protein
VGIAVDDLLEEVRSAVSRGEPYNVRIALDLACSPTFPSASIDYRGRRWYAASCRKEWPIAAPIRAGRVLVEAVGR